MLGEPYGDRWTGDGWTPEMDEAEYRMHGIGNVGLAVTFWRDDAADQKIGIWGIWPPGLRGDAPCCRCAEPSGSAPAGGASASRAAQRVAAAAGANCTGWPRGRAIGQRDPQR